MKAKAALLALLIPALPCNPAFAESASDTTFSNFGGTDYFPASSGTVPLTNTQLAAPGNSLSGSSLSAGSSSLPTGSSPSSVPGASFSSGPTLNSGAAPSSVPSGF